ncbi:hypothetical protein H8959_001901 [Pygathrix nigripes]
MDWEGSKALEGSAYPIHPFLAGDSGLGLGSCRAVPALQPQGSASVSSPPPPLARRRYLLRPPDSPGAVLTGAPAGGSAASNEAAGRSVPSLPSACVSSTTCSSSQSPAGGKSSFAFLMDPCAPLPIPHAKGSQGRARSPLSAFGGTGLEGPRSAKAPRNRISIRPAALSFEAHGITWLELSADRSAWDSGMQPHRASSRAPGAARAGGDLVWPCPGPRGTRRRNVAYWKNRRLALLSMPLIFILTTL